MSLPAASTLQPGSDVRHLLVMAEALVEDFDKILARIGIKILASVLAKFKPDKPDFHMLLDKITNARSLQEDFSHI